MTYSKVQRIAVLSVSLLGLTEMLVSIFIKNYRMLAVGMILFLIFGAVYLLFRKTDKMLNNRNNAQNYDS